MKQSILTALLLSVLLSPGAFAATKQTSINLTSFNSISVSGPFKVSLVKGADYRILITLEEPYMDYLVCNVSGQTLQLDLDERNVPVEVKRQFRGKGSPDPVFSAVVYVPDAVRSVVLNGKSVLHDTEDVFDKSEVFFTLNDNSNVNNLDVDSRQVHIVMQNKSTADFSVVCDKLEAETFNSASLSISDASAESNYYLQNSSSVSAVCRTSTLNVNSRSNSAMTVSGTGDNAIYNLGGTSEVHADKFEVPDAKVTMSSLCVLSQSAYRKLTVNLSGGATLVFANNPQMDIEIVKASTITRAEGDVNTNKSE